MDALISLYLQGIDQYRANIKADEVFKMFKRHMGHPLANAVEEDQEFSDETTKIVVENQASTFRAS